jgi:hypothetical protein
MLAEVDLVNLLHLHILAALGALLLDLDGTNKAGVAEHMPAHNKEQHQESQHTPYLHKLLLLIHKAAD